MHWEWVKCPKALHGQFKRKDKRYPTIMLEAVVDQQLWFWHAYFRVPGANNDLNVLYGSPLFDDLLAEKAPFQRLVSQGIKKPPSLKSSRKDIEKAFGVLQGRWRIIQQLTRAYHMNTIRRIMYTCMILHNMILEDQNFDIIEYWHMYASPESNIQRTWVERCERQRRRNKELRDRRVHEDLRHDIVEHLWNQDNEI
ncbi:ALP1-like protein [Tanacetum coccineum]